MSAMARALGIAENPLRKLLRGKLTLTPDHGVMLAALQLLDEERVRKNGAPLTLAPSEAASERRLRQATARRDTAAKLAVRPKLMIG
jgi:hypothetical protein